MGTFLSRNIREHRDKTKFKVPSWKIEKMLKAIHMTQDSFVGKESISEEEWNHCIRANCFAIGLMYDADLESAAFKKEEEER